MKNDMINLESVSYTGICRELLHYAWMILLMGITVWLGATGIGMLTYQPVYTASSTLAVNTRGSTNIYSGLSTATQMANVFSQVFQSDALRDLITQDTGEMIEGTIECRQITETNLLVLETTSSNPRQAYLFLNSALKNYDEVSEYVFANASLEVVQEPSIPKAPSNTSWLIAHRMQLLLLGMLGMLLLIVLFYLFRYTVKTKKAAEGLLDGKIQGTIPYESKALGWSLKNSKEALLINSPVVSMGYAEACRKLEAGIEYYMRRQKQKVLLVCSVGENEGKSTVAANIALALAERRKKVLLVDGDLRKPAQHKVFEQREKTTASLSEVLAGKKTWQDAIFYHETLGIWQLFQYQPVSKVSHILESFRLREWMQECRREMDYIVVDCSPAAAAADAEVWMQVVDTVLLVVREDWSDVRVINDTVDMIWQSGADFVGFVLNAFHDEWFESGSSYGYGDRSYRGYE